MSTIDISRAHSLDKEEARRRAETLARTLEDKLGIRWNWDGDRIRFHAPGGAAKGSSGTVSVDPKTVRVEVDLPFLLRAIKGTIEGKINKNLDELLG
jgi:putative polyhydroxyalkanoate system protein